MASQQEVATIEGENKELAQVTTIKTSAEKSTVTSSVPVSEQHEVATIEGENKELAQVTTIKTSAEKSTVTSSVPVSEDKIVSHTNDAQAWEEKCAELKLEMECIRRDLLISKKKSDIELYMKSKIEKQLVRSNKKQLDMIETIKRCNNENERFRRKFEAARKIADNERYMKFKAEKELADFQTDLFKIYETIDLTNIELSKLALEHENASIKSELSYQRDEIIKLTAQLAQKTNLHEGYRHKLSVDEKLAELAPLPELLKKQVLDIEQGIELRRLEEVCASRLTFEMDILKNELLEAISSGKVERAGRLQLLTTNREMYEAMEGDRRQMEIMRENLDISDTRIRFLKDQLKNMTDRYHQKCEQCQVV